MVTKVEAPIVVLDAWSVYDDGASMFSGLFHASNGDLVQSYSTMPDGLVNPGDNDILVVSYSYSPKLPHG